MNDELQKTMDNLVYPLYRSDEEFKMWHFVQQEKELQEKKLHKQRWKEWKDILPLLIIMEDRKKCLERLQEQIHNNPSFNFKYHGPCDLCRRGAHYPQT